MVWRAVDLEYDSVRWEGGRRGGPGEATGRPRGGPGEAPGRPRGGLGEGGREKNIH
jgi:hypothetical protein